jgi:hypothetical protein
MPITPQQARQELARREIARRSGQPSQNGQEDSFLDDAAKLPGMVVKSAVNLPSDIWNGVKQVPGMAQDALLHPVNATRDVLGGVARGSQHLAAALGDAGQYIGDTVAGGITGKKMPKIDIDEEMGLGKNNPVDLGSMMASQNPNQGLMALGQYGLGAAASGTKVLPMIAGNMANAATQAPVGQREQAGVEGAMAGAVPLPAKIPAAYKYATPERDVAPFMTKLGNGATTAEENIGQLTNRIQTAARNNKEDALATKQAVIKSAGKDRIDRLPQFDAAKVAKVFTSDKSDLTSKNMAALSKAIDNYYKHQNLGKFTDRAENIFGQEALTPAKIDKLDGMLSSRESEYLTKGTAHEFYDRDLKKLHEEFEKNPTFVNADKLQSQLGTELGYYQRLSRSGKLDPADMGKLRAFKKSRDLLNADQDSYLAGKSPELQNQYEEFKQKWRDNVVPYSSSKTLRDIVKNGENAGITRSKISSEFSFPDKNSSKVAKDIGSTGHGNILYNELQKVSPGDAKGLADAILEAKRVKGYQKYVTPELEQAANQFKDRAKWNHHLQALKASAAGAIGGGIFGHPIMGAAAGLAYKEGQPLLAKYLSRSGRK